MQKQIKNVSNCIGHFRDPSSIKKLSKYLSHNVSKEPLILCIGTDR